jgi:hypothetical protein
MPPSWTITYDDGDNFKTASASGKLSLDSSWAFILDAEAVPPVVVLAVPRHRVIDILLDEDDDDEDEDE